MYDIVIYLFKTKKNLNLTEKIVKDEVEETKPEIKSINNFF